jgi:uncharacterized protein (TIGR02246 family)
MRWSRIVALGLSLGWAGACSSAQPSVDITKDKAAIDTTRDAYVSAWRSGNAADVTGLYADDALVLYPNRPPIVGKAAIQTYFSQFFGDFGQHEFELRSAEIEIAGSWAFDRGTYRWKGTPKAGGDSVEDHGKYVVILKRQSDGSWKVARDMDNSDRPLTQTTRGAG